jgi:hypothetical protein
MPINQNYATSGSEKTSPLWATSHALADEGSYFVAMNPTVGTAIAMTTSVVDDAATASATHAQNVPYIYIQNKGAVNDNNGKSLFLQYIKLFSRVGDQAWTSATQALFSLRADNTGDRRTTRGTSLVAYNANTYFGQASSADITAGTNVTSLPSATSGRVLTHGLVQSSIPLAGSTWVFTFGDAGMSTNFAMASAINTMTIPCPPVVLAPGWSLQFDLWATALAAAPTFEVEIGYAERFQGL